MDGGQLTRIVNFIFEAGTSQNILRTHSQVLKGASDSLASHSFRTAIIGLLLAKIEGADSDKVLRMCLLHDFAEIRTGDANFIHAQYRKERAKEERNASKDQWEETPIKEEVLQIISEYEKRKTKEAIVAKDADILDQIFLQIEALPQGSYNLIRWHNHQAKKLKTDSAGQIAELALKTSPFEWLYRFSDSQKGK